MSRRSTVASILLTAIFAASAWLRWPGFVQGGFASHDVAGILYGGMLLVRGGLPYVDSIEFKGPATFYLARVFAGDGANDIATFQIWANTWALTSLFALTALAWRRFGPGSAVVTASVYACCDAYLDSMDANYVTWAQLPQILCVLATLEARHTKPRWPWFLAGAAAGFAAQCKQPFGLVIFVPLVAALMQPDTMSDRGRPTLTKIALVVGGTIIAHAPIAVHYLVRGEFQALMHGYAFNSWAARYVTHHPAGAEVVKEGALATVHFLALPLALAVFAIRPPPRHQRTATLLWIWALVALASAGLGFRFYKGYYLMLAAPLAVIAGVSWGWFHALHTRAAARMVSAVPLALLLARQLTLLADARSDRFLSHDAGGRKLAAFISENTQPHERIWVWGWHLWDVYPLSNRMSASRVYKSLGLLTPVNDDTWRRPGTRLRHVDGPAVELLMSDFEAAPPAYVLLGSTVPRDEFVALQTFLHRSYQRDYRIRVGRVQIWRHIEADPLPPATRIR